MASNVPSFTILNDALGDDLGQMEQQSMQPPQPAWQSMYQSNILSPPPNSSILANDMSQMAEPNYDSLTHHTPTPNIPASYGASLFNNAAVSSKNLRFNLPATPSAPLPSYLDVPYVNPPYGTSYPSSGYSAYDGAQAMNAGMPQFYSPQGVPAASWPALQDARDSPSVPIGPNNIAIIAERHYKEGFNRGREQYAESYQPACSQCVAHIEGCPICNGYMNGDKKLYRIGIGVLLIFILILLWMLFRRMSGQKNESIANYPQQ